MNIVTDCGLSIAVGIAAAERFFSTSGWIVDDSILLLRGCPSEHSRGCARSRLSCLWALSIFLCISGTLHSEARAALAPDSIKLTESYSESVRAIRGVEGKTFVKSATDFYVITGKVRLEDFDLEKVSPNSVFDLNLGKVQIHQRLKDDPKYTEGAKRARFFKTLSNEQNKAVAAQLITLSWNDRYLNFSIRAVLKPGQAADWTAVRADGFSGQKTGNVSSPITGALVFNSVGLNYPDGTLKAKIKTKKAVKGGEAFTLSKVKVAGGGIGTTVATSVRATPGSEVTITQSNIPPAGGTLTVGSGALAGTKVTLPTGAVSSDAQFILLENKTTLVPRSGTFSGKTINIKTNGASTFAEPMRITVPIDPNPSKVPVPYYIDDHGYLHPCQLISVDHTARNMVFETFHASLYTWLYAVVTGEGGNSAYRPPNDGFQVVNTGSIYNPGGECFGISAFAQWYYRNAGGGLFPRYMQDIPVPSGGSVKGQNIIATRAHTSVSRFWSSYVPRVAAQQNLSANQVYASIANVIDNTAAPAILYLDQGSSRGTHAVLAYDHNDTGRLAINDPNYPGENRIAQLLTGLTYDSYQRVRLIGDGSLRKESFQNIYNDAENGFSGNGAAQIQVSSHTDGEEVSERTVTLTGIIESGQLLVDKLEVWLNGTTKFEQEIGPDGFFSLPVSLVSGDNLLTFRTKFHDLSNSEIDAPNTQLAPFKLRYNDSSVILITLTWNTGDTDLDLYTIDPNGDYSAYYHQRTADGGELDYDVTGGYGPEHWTLLSNKVIRWGQNYRVRIHYYSDHVGGTGAAIPSSWTVNVILYEGTARTLTQTYTGVLSSDNSSNTRPDGAGADWVDVCTITPVQATGPAARATFIRDSAGRPQITVPIPPEYFREEQKLIHEAGVR